MQMIILLLMMWMGNAYAKVTCTNKEQECSWINSNLTEIPKELSKDIIKLNLAQNNISLDKANIEALKQYRSLKELNLSNNNIKSLLNATFSELTKLEVLILNDNHITAVEAWSFQGLENLRILDLGYNQILELPTNIVFPFRQLQTFNLQNNNFTYLDFKGTLKDVKTPLNVTLSGNPWNCSCSLMNLSDWLNETTVILENEDTTLCATPENMKNYTIKAILTLSDMNNCTNNGNTTSISTTTSFESPTTLDSVTNGTSIPVVNGTAATPTQGNSWRFLVGVVVVGIVTLLLILAAIKFPKWYDFLISYNHHRLKEEEPYMFEEEFNVDFSMGPNDKNPEEDETVVVFEQTHSFMPEEDGFIEDKYIDERDMRAES